MQNVTVLALPSDERITMHKKMLSMPVESWMVDELVLPDLKYGDLDHIKWAEELQQLR